MISPFTISLLMKALLTNNDVHKCFHSKRKDVQVLSKEMFEFNKILEKYSKIQPWIFVIEFHIYYSLTTWSSNFDVETLLKQSECLNFCPSRWYEHMKILIHRKFCRTGQIVLVLILIFLWAFWAKPLAFWRYHYPDTFKMKPFQFAVRRITT